MNTVILNGSPRKKGDTMALVEAFCSGLQGQVRIIDAYGAKAAPCIDCRGCFRAPGCVIKDGMQEVYRAVEEADVVALASPLYFSTLTGSLLALCSRFQALYAGRSQGFFEAPLRNARGVLLLTGGGSTKDPACAVRTARIILREVGAPLEKTVYSLHTDQVAAKDDKTALEQCVCCARELTRP